MIKEYVVKVTNKVLPNAFTLFEEEYSPEQDIVRCKDCKWYDERISMCDNCGLPREQTFFCADGKRNEGR